MLKRKLLRDLWQGRTQFISIFLMAFLGLAIFVGIDAESNGIGLSTAAYYQTTNLADSWVIGNGFTEEEVRKLTALPQIDTVDRKIVISGKAKTSEGAEFDMELNFLESMQCSYPYLIEGESFAPGKKGIWLEEVFARERGYHVGDRIRLKYESVEFTEEVKGIIIHPEYLFYTLESDSMMPNYGNYGYGFLSKLDFPVQEQLAYNRLVIKQNEENRSAMDTMTFKELVKSTLGRDEVVVLDQSQNEGIDSIANEESQHAAMGIMFSAVFLLIAVMGIVTTMTRMTSNQRIQIGTLKALGFSKARITGHYVSYGVVISAVGSLLGAVSGKLLLPSLFLPSMSAYYILPEWKTGISGQSYVAVVLAIAVSSFVSFLSCRKALRDMPAITLKPAVPKNLRHSFLEKSRIWLSLRFSTQWNVRD
ncbi:MAG: ABC transporter permease, partial [Lachnospiraceae bacterium]|nr:ABC transporter permease [Lachnospiraceae bacterium]